MTQLARRFALRAKRYAMFSPCDARLSIVARSAKTWTIEPPIFSLNSRKGINSVFVVCMLYSITLTARCKNGTVCLTRPACLYSFGVLDQLRCVDSLSHRFLESFGH